jgi:hypothetical protein
VYFIVLIFCLCVTGCKREESSSFTGEYIYREKGESRLALNPPQKKVFERYPWQKAERLYPLITKEHFRCKGCTTNVAKMISRGGAIELCRDCDGMDGHTLPIRDEKEFVYPKLLEILNAIQDKFSLPVRITSGHRCQEHQHYITEGLGSRFSKHLIGAAVTFYVEGMESNCELVIDAIQDLYRNKDGGVSNQELSAFRRWDVDKTDVSTPPWYNKEIFIKLFLPHEGRDGDNSHAHAYIEIQMRYDFIRQEKVLAPDEKGPKLYWRKG